RVGVRQAVRLPRRVRRDARRRRARPLRRVRPGPRHGRRAPGPAGRPPPRPPPRGGARTVIRLDYVRDGAEIYRRSFATIRAEADLSQVPDDLEKAAVRMIHACGMVDLVDDLAFSPG